MDNTMNNNFLSKVCHECIKYSFYYGIFADFKIIMDKVTGYFNATKLCEQGGKDYKKWACLEKSEDMLKYYTSLKCNDYYEVKFSKKDKLSEQIIGIYVPEELILDIVSWVSVAFYTKCNSIIVNFFTNKDNKQFKGKVENKHDKLVIIKRKTSPNAIVTTLSEINIIVLDN